MLPMQGMWVWSLVRELDRSRVSQLRVHMSQQKSKILHIATKTQYIQINKYYKTKRVSTGTGSELSITYSHFQGSLRVCVCVCVCELLSYSWLFATT